MHEPCPLTAAWAWLDSIPWNAIETAPAMIGRVLAEAVISGAALPGHDIAAWDGAAVSAAATEGASPYNPLHPVGGVHPVTCGASVVPPCDAVLPPEMFDEAGLVVAATAPGLGVIRRGEQLSPGAEALPAGRLLRPVDVALLAALAIDRVALRRRPRVRIVADADLAPLIAGLLTQDGAAIEADPTVADLWILAGEAGRRDPRVRLDHCAVAIRPGGASGLGWRGATPALLLPAEPLACVAACTLLGSRLVRRMAGLGNRATVAATLGRKLTSGLGYAEMVRVRIERQIAEPLGGLETGGIAGAARADGFVLVPAESEGYAAGAAVTVEWFSP